MDEASQRGALLRAASALVPVLKERAATRALARQVFHKRRGGRA